MTAFEELFWEEETLMCMHAEYCFDYGMEDTCDEFEDPGEDCFIPMPAEVTKKLSGSTCLWQLDDGFWSGKCGIAWSLDEGTPEENKINFCPGCGKMVVAVEE
jgi:hypothetical protein